MTFADDFFETQIKSMTLDDYLLEQLSPLFSDIWLDTLTSDYYDYSIEFNTEHGAVLSQEQIEKLSNLGFRHCWLNYPNKTNKSFFLGLK